jgi:hypothetical protein
MYLLLPYLTDSNLDWFATWMDNPGWGCSPEIVVEWMVNTRNAIVKR